MAEVTTLQNRAVKKPQGSWGNWGEGATLKTSLFLFTR